MFVFEARQQELTHRNTAIFDSRAADQKGLCPGTAGQPGGFEIEEADVCRVRTRLVAGPRARHHLQRVVAFADRLDEVTNSTATMTPIGRVVAIDDQHGAVARGDPLAAEN